MKTEKAVQRKVQIETSLQASETRCWERRGSSNCLKGWYKDKGSSSWELWLWRVRLGVTQKDGAALA